METCNFQCLSNCPLPPGQDCLYDDPDIGMFDLIEYPKFFWWRVEHNIKPEDDWSVNGPNPITPRCPRCHSTNVGLGYAFPNDSIIQCYHCNYAEPLIDYPSNKY